MELLYQFEFYEVPFLLVSYLEAYKKKNSTHKTMCNDVEWWCWKQGSTLGCNAMVCWSWGKMMWRRKELNWFNCVEFCHAGPVAAMWRFFICPPHEWDARADRGACGKLLRGERKWKKLSFNTWQILIGSLDFTHFNNLNSIISLQIIYFILFLPKFMIFFVYK